MLPPYHSKVSCRSGITYSLFYDHFRSKLGSVKQGIFFPQQRAGNHLVVLNLYDVIG
jgi:hypothetical protein